MSSMAHIKRILVPVDGSPASRAALAEAVAVAEDTGAAIDVLHVVAPEPFEQRGSSGSPAPAAFAVAQVDMETAVDEVSSRLGERLSRRTESGDPLRKILETAEEGSYDLVVMGTRGRVGRLHMLIGSVAEGVVRNAPCPVMTVRAP
jgi:nucleotide-binding universal stress UspA family protein